MRSKPAYGSAERECDSKIERKDRWYKVIAAGESAFFVKAKRPTGEVISAGAPSENGE